MPKRLVTTRLVDIRYTQDSIASHFKDGPYTFDESVANLRNGTQVMGDAEGDFPRITVVKCGPFFFAMNNRRLACLKKAFLEGRNSPGKGKSKVRGQGRQKGKDISPDFEVQVWEQDLTRAIMKDLAWRFTAGLFVTERGGKASGSNDTSASDFLVRQLTDEQQEAMRDAVREEYEEKIQQLKNESEKALRRLDELSQHEQHTDEEVGEKVLACLTQRGASILQSIRTELEDQPSAFQLDRVLNSLVDKGQIVIARNANTSRADAIYAVPRSPLAHPRLEVAQAGGSWCMISSAAVRQNVVLDGRSLAEQNYYIGCTLSLGNVGCGARAVVRLQGQWANNDKLLIGVWPEETDISQCFLSPGPDSSETDCIKRAPGYWVSCSSGYLLHEAQRFSPIDWIPPKKINGVQWGVQLSDSRSLQIACADIGQELTWCDRKWFGEPALPKDMTGLAPALMFQPHNRSDASRAEIVIQEAGHMGIEVQSMTSLDGSL